MILYPLLPETPYWLVLNGRPAEAEAVLHQMAKMNGVLLPQVTLCLSIYLYSVFPVQRLLLFPKKTVLTSNHCYSKVTSSQNTVVGSHFCCLYKEIIVIKSVLTGRDKLL